MAIAQMKKVIIASHYIQAGKLLEAIQEAQILQILDAERAMVTKEWPELHTETQRPKDIEDTLEKLERSIVFIQGYSDKKKSLAETLAPKTVIARQQYADVAASSEALDKLTQCLALAEEIETLNGKKQNTQNQLEELMPWARMTSGVEEISQPGEITILAGLLPSKNFEDIVEKITELGVAIETVGNTAAADCCIVAGFKDAMAEAQKILRMADFEIVTFAGLTGTPDELIKQNLKQLAEIDSQLLEATARAQKLSADELTLKILGDYYANLLDREQTRLSVPETEQTVLLEGWVKAKDFGRLKKTVAKFDACSVGEMPLAEGEEAPVEIDNNKAVKPFETITRLHGMPNLADVDPTAFLAPFFALFFGLCLTDAGYGIIIAVALWWLIKKIQGNKNALWMFFICSISTIVAGALTGGWFGDAFQALIPQETAAFRVLNGFRERLMLFDPMKEPITFFMISLALGYFQIIFALFIGLFNNIFRKDYATAVFNFLVWIIFLNSLAVLGLGKAIAIPAMVSQIAGWIAISQAVLIFCFSERKSGMAGRIGGGVFSLFSTVFYFGDVLSYVRIMALGMVTAGLGIAINILVKLVMEVPYVGFFLGALLFVGGHTLNIALSVLSSFVHSLRLQFVEFFPKFFTGGGKEFKPLSLCFKHLMIKTEKTNVR